MTPSIHGVPLHTPNSRLLRVKVVRVKDLARDMFGSHDPFVQLTLCKKSNESSVIEVVKTNVVKKTTNPFYNMDFIFNVVPKDHKLVIDVLSENKITRNDFLGRVNLPLDNSRIIISNETEPNARNKIDFPLEKKFILNKVKGKLNLIVHFISSIDLIDAILASDGGTPEPSVSASTASAPDAASVLDLSTEASAGAEASAEAAAANDDANQALPPGFEQRLDQNGRIYYIDHVNKITTWIRPTTRAEPNDAQINSERTGSTTSASRTRNAAPVAQMPRRHINDVSNNNNRNNNDTASLNGGPSGLGASRSSLSASTPSLSGDRARTGSLNSNDATEQGDSSGSETNAQASDDNAAASSTEVGIRPKPNEAPLPPGWDFSYSDKGRMFFIDHANKTTSWIDPRTGKPTPIPNLDFPSRIGPLPSGWEERRHGDGRIFYIDHNRRQTQWEDPRLQKFAGPAVPYSRDYKQKFDSFRRFLPPPPPKGSQYGGVDKYFIRVKRTNVLEDSYNKIMHEKNPELLRMPVWIEFEGEKSYDYGGVSREWFHVLSKEIFNPYYGLFEHSAIDNYTLQINSNSGLVNEHHLDYFYFIGRVVGMAAYHNRLIDGFFIRPFYKMMLGKPIVLQDIEAVDIEYYKSMKYIMETDAVEDLDLTFVCESDVYGQKVEHELKPNGANIKVNNENRKEFIDLVVQWKFVQRIEKQMSNFMRGFNEIVPQRCILLFDPKEFELLLSGLGDVNIKDWQINTAYKGDYNMQHRVIQWFWMAMYSFPNELRLRFLQFVTGTSRVPMNGFAELQGSNGYQKFTIQSWGDYKSLPRAHTCFNRLDLPPYRSYEELREKLLLAIENSEGFDGVD